MIWKNKTGSLLYILPVSSEKQQQKGIKLNVKRFYQRKHLWGRIRRELNREEGRKVGWKPFRLTQCLRKFWQGYWGPLSQASESPSCSKDSSAFTSHCNSNWLGAAHGQPGFGANVAIYFRLLCLDTRLIVVPVVGVYDSYPNDHHNVTITKILKCCHYIFSTIYKVVVPGNKIPVNF